MLSGLMIVVGTRPELIKMAPVLRECQRRSLKFFFIHTGQHYSPEMDAVFFKDLGLPEPNVNLHVGTGLHGQQTATMLEGLEQLMLQEEPEAVLVQGDTNSVLAAVLAASKLHIPIGHIEAGLRSRDWRQPEEKNRIVADHLSDYLFAPTEESIANIRSEGIPESRIWLAGNTIVDSVLQNIEIARSKSGVLERLSLKPKKFLLATAHREEYVDRPESLKEVVSALGAVGTELSMSVIWPVHPRTRNKLKDFAVAVPENVKLIEPQGYIDFLMLESSAFLILSDSGGVQEEACILNVPCVVLREFSDRPESIMAGAAMLAGTDQQKILAASRKMACSKCDWLQPWGDGHSAEKILDAVANAGKAKTYSKPQK